MPRCVFALFLLAAAATAQPSGVTSARYAHLARGVNLNNWFEYGSPLAVTEADVKLLKNAGFTCIRLPVAPQYLLPHWATSEAIAKNLNDLDAAVDLFISHGMAVMLDFQADPDYVAYYWSTPSAPQELISTWQMLASRYANRDPELLFFEVMNEPTNAWTQAAWDAEQLQAIAAIHQVAPQHTVLASPTNWSALEALLAMKPYSDPNVIYVLHFYNPFTFTHQGATWVNSPTIASLRNVPYPASLPDLQTLIDQTTEAAQLAQLVAYQTGYWNAKRIDWDIQLAAAWARRWGVRVVVNEFGAYKKYSPLDSRVRWIRDLQSACSKYGLGWAMWDYQSGFDLVVGLPGARSIDPSLVPALDPAPQTSGDPLPPLTRDELIDLCARPLLRRHPERVLDEFVRKRKIAFLPTKREVSGLRHNGVPVLVADQLKFNFASQLSYRVCQFTASTVQDSSWTELVNAQLEAASRSAAPSALPFHLTFDPVPCPAAGPSQAELNQTPNLGYVVIMGTIDRDDVNPAKGNITARLVFVSSHQQATSLIPPLVVSIDGSEKFTDPAKRIIEWSIKELENQLD